MTEEKREAQAQADREKKRVALTSVAAAVVLTGAKTTIGVLTGSLGILSEAAHSGLDLIAAIVTYFAVRFSGRPPDKEHTYGHGKIENLSAFFETVLLLVTCAWIIKESITRLFFQKHEVEANAWSFVVIALSLVIDYSRSRALMRVAKKHNSQALEADALHFSTDIWSSAVVLVGLVCVWLADRVGKPWLDQADSVAALGVAGIVVWVSIQLGKRTIDDLLDAVEPGLREEVARAAMAPGVLQVLETRVRRGGPDVFVEISVSFDRSLAFEKVHDITTQVEERVRKVLSRAQVVVHAEPVKGQDENLEAQVRLAASRQGLAVHSVRVSEKDGKQNLDLHLEVDRKLTVGEAHAQADALETDLHAAHPGLTRITVHLEPARAEVAHATGAPISEERVMTALQAASRECELRCQPHDVEVGNVDGELAVTCHCWIAPSAPITAAHSLTQQLEQRLRLRLPQLGRVVIHVEPDPRQAEKPKTKTEQ